TVVVAERERDHDPGLDLDWSAGRADRSGGVDRVKLDGAVREPDREHSAVGAVRHAECTAAEPGDRRDRAAMAARVPQPDGSTSVCARQLIRLDGVKGDAGDGTAKTVQNRFRR